MQNLLATSDCDLFHRGSMHHNSGAELLRPGSFSTFPIERECLGFESISRLVHNDFDLPSLSTPLDAFVAVLV